MSIREPEGQWKEETETEPTENVISSPWGDPPSGTGRLLPHPPGVIAWPKTRRPQKSPAGPLPCHGSRSWLRVPRQLCRGKGDLIAWEEGTAWRAPHPPQDGCVCATGVEESVSARELRA